MPIKKASYLLVAMLLLACVSGKAQMGMSFMSGSGTVVATPSIAVSGNAKCLTVGGTAAVLNIAHNGTGLFGAGCKEGVPTADTIAFSMSLSVYPNPTRGAAMLKATGDFDQQLSCVVKVVAMDGKVMMGQMVPMSTVKAGFMINGNAWAAGNYTVLVEVMNKRYSLRLIKL